MSIALYTCPNLPPRDFLPRAAVVAGADDVGAVPARYTAASSDYGID